MFGKDLKKIDLKAHRGTWEPVDTTMLSEEARLNYEKHKKAVDYYIDGYSPADIEAATGVKAPRIRYDIRRCLTVDAAGREFGYAALIPYVNIKEKTAKKDGFSYQFNDLMEKYPQVRDNILKNLKGKGKNKKKNMSYKEAFLAFHKDLRKAGVLDQEYPFNVPDKGFSAFYKYAHNLLREDINIIGARLHKDAARKLLSTGTGEKMTLQPIHPYANLQIDGHKLDVFFVTDKIENGVPKTVLCDRAYLLAVMSPSSRAILGGHLTTHDGYDHVDVLKAIQNAIMPKEIKEYTIPGLKCPDNGGFPDTAYEALEHAMPISIMFDNAKAHLAVDVINNLTGTGTVLNYGSVATPETRGIVERFFRTLEERGFHRLIVTTGSHPKDPIRRQDAEKLAVKLGFDFDKVEQIVDYVIREYNNSIHSSTNESPIQNVYRNTIQAGCMPAIAEGSMLESVEHLTWYKDEATVRGNCNKGVRPYIEYKGARYSGTVLSSNDIYRGKKVTLFVDPDNANDIQVFDQSGEKIDTVHVCGFWSKFRHSFKVRSYFGRKGQYAGYSDESNGLTQEAIEFLNNPPAKRERAAASKVARIRRDTDVFEQIEKAGMKDPSAAEAGVQNTVEADKKIGKEENAEIQKDIDTLSQEELFKKYKGRRW